MALTPEGRTAERLADLDRRAAQNERGVPWTGSSKTFVDSDRLNVGSFVQGTQFDVVIPASAFLGIYMRSLVTNPNASGSSIFGEAGLTINGSLWGALILADGGGGSRWWFSSPGTGTGSNSPGGIVIVDDESAPLPSLSISDQPQEVTLGFGYQRVNAGSNMDFENNRMTIFFL